MAKEFLDLSQVSAHIEQMGRITMAQSMRMDVLTQVRANRALSQNPSRLTRRKPSRLFIPPRTQRDKKGLAHEPRMASHLEPLTKCLPRLRRNRHDAFLPALAHHADFLSTQFEIPYVERHQLADANPRPVQELH